MILNLEDIDRIYIAPGYVDFRKSIDGLVSIAASQCNADVYSKNLFVFFSRDRRRAKMIFWDGSGFWLFYKRLESERFKWKKSEEVTCVSSEALYLLLKGYDIIKVKPFEEKKYTFL